MLLRKPLLLRKNLRRLLVLGMRTAFVNPVPILITLS
jgi:hypothetical protein